jgi:hypothetical protein
VGAVLIGACFVLSAAPALAQHDHVVTAPVSIGPLILRIALLAAVPAIAAFAVLRAFLPEPTRTGAALVAGAAAGTVMLELMLSDGLDIPPQAVVLVLAGLAVPLFLILSRDERFTTAIARARTFAPWVVSVAAALAFVEFARVWLDNGKPALLHTAVVLALVGLSWFTVCRPRHRAARILIRIEAGVLATAVLAGSAQAMVLRPPSPASPGVAMVSDVALGPDRVGVLVVPHRPGWNLVHVQADDAAVGTDPEFLTPTIPQPGATGSWAAVLLPAGRGELWISRRGQTGSVPTDTGTQSPVTSEFGGQDGPECASAVLARQLAGPSPPDRCPADALTPDDAGMLRATVDFLTAQGTRQITLITDNSPRSDAAEQVVRGTGIAVADQDSPQGPVLIVSGWSAADAALRRVAEGALPNGGSYLAPWLLTAPLLAIPAAQHIPLRFTPGDEQAQRYVLALRGRFPGEQPTSSGYAAWVAARNSTVDIPVRMHVVTPLPQTPAQATDWMQGAKITPVSTG